MLENLKRTSMAGFLGLLSPWVIVALVVALMAASGLAGARLNGQRWAAKYERLQHSYESAQSQAQAVAAQQTQANAEQSAQLDKTYYEEFQNATKTLIIGALAICLSACQASPKLHTVPKLAPPAAWAMTPPPTIQELDRLTCLALRLSNCENTPTK